MPGLVLDVSRWPMIVTSIEGPIDLADWERYAARFEREVMARGEPIVSVFDMSGLCNVPDQRTRTRIADWSKRHESFGLDHHRGLAIVAPNPLARALMKVLHWTVPPKVPTSYEPDRRSAERYCRQRMIETGLLPAATDALGG